MRLTPSLIVLGLLIILMPLLPALANDAQMEVEPNDTMATANVVVRTPLVGHVGGEGDEADWYVIPDVYEGTMFDFVIEHNPDECAIDFEVFSDGTSVGLAGGETSPDGLSCEVTGTCHVRVYSVSGQGAYDLDFSTYDYCYQPQVVGCGCPHPSL